MSDLTNKPQDELGAEEARTASEVGVQTDRADVDEAVAQGDAPARLSRPSRSRPPRLSRPPRPSRPSRLSRPPLPGRNPPTTS